MTQTWPEDWDARKRGVGCWFCAKQLGQPFYGGRAGDAHLERHPIARWGDVHTVAQMIERVFAPCHMNYQLLGNLVPHLHVHLVPRYLDDPAPGRPLPWEPKALADSEFDSQVQLLKNVARTMTSV
jgi:hypothetical protein